MGKYKVTKIKVDRENTDIFVKSGYTTIGEVTQLVIGMPMVVKGVGFDDFLVTSPVEKIEPANNENLLVGTRNSTYSLEKVT